MSLTGYDIAGVNGSGIITKALIGDFTICKATEGLTFNDSLHDTFVSKLHAAGKLVGHYHYAHPAHNAVEEADHFVTRANPRTGDVMALDFEPYNQGTNEATWPEWIIAFCARVKERTGASCWVYLNDFFANHTLAQATAAQATALHTIPLWKAGRNNAYVSSPSVGPGDLHGWPALTCWQWKGTTIDEDIFYGDAATWRALAANPTPLPEDDMTPDELMDFDTVPSPMLGPDNPTATVRGALALTMQWALAGRNAAQAAARDSAAGLEIITKYVSTPGDTLTEAEIEAAAERGAQKAIDAEITGATVQLNVTQPTP